MANLIDVFQNKLVEYRAKRDGILTNRDLTQAAKLKRAEGLRVESLESLTETGNVLWRSLESELRAANVALQRAKAEANAGWDYQRLEYEAGAVPSLLAGVRSIQEIAALYEQIKATGDPYKVRAFREYVPELIASRNYPSTGGVGSLIQTLKRDAEEAATTPAVRKAESNAAALIDRILAARDATLEAINEFALNQNVTFAATSTLNPLVLWLRRLQIEREPVPNDPLKEIVKVDFAQPESNRVATLKE